VSGPGYKPAPLTPRSPTELREATVRDYAANARRMGLEVSTDALERVAVADLEMVDAYRRGLDTSPKTGPVKKPEARASQLIASPTDGPPLKAAPKHRERPDVLYKRAHLRSEKWSSAVARIARILEGAKAGLTLELTALNAEVPALALEYARLYANFRTRKRQFSDRSNRDALRMFEAAVYDICDRSTSKLGHWWVK